MSKASETKTWNYRVMCYTDSQGGKTYGIHSVYYDKNDNITGYSAEPTPLIGDTLEELREDFSKALLAFDKPVLDQE